MFLTILHNIPSIVIHTVQWITIIGVICVVVMENKNPLKTISWIIVLFFLPFIGLLLYFFFGQDIRKKRMISKKGYKQMKKRVKEKYDISAIEDVSDNTRHLMQLLYEIDNALPLPANDITIYTNGKEKMEAFFKSIQEAKHHIHLQYYIIENDTIGNKLLNLLIQKSKEGVKIRVIYDDVACWRVNKSFYEKMKEEGIEVRSFLKVRLPLFTSKINYRNHRKLAIIDGNIGFIGGMNIADRYVNGLSWGIWRDTHIRITGHSVYRLQASFLLDWYFVNQTLVTSRDYFPEMYQPKSKEIVQITTSGPTDLWHNILQGYLCLITNAHQYLYIQTPYFMPLDTITTALQTAALSNVDVRLMIPERSDTLFTCHASRSYLRELMEAGVKIFFYKKGFLHSKVIVCDDFYSVVGSVNMDFRSFEHNFEIAAFVYGESTAKELKRIFLNDQQDSVRIKLKEWEKRPLIEKVKESVIRLFSPLL